MQTSCSSIFLEKTYLLQFVLLKFRFICNISMFWYVKLAFRVVTYAEGKRRKIIDNEKNI